MTLAAVELLGPAHSTVLFLTITIPAVLVWLARGRPDRQVLFARSLAGVLLLNKLVVFSYACIFNTVPWSHRLPMQLCDWVTFITAYALLSERRLPRELAYFWGLAGTLQATLTPDLGYDFPHFYFFTFNISHSGIIISVLFIVFSLGFRPTVASIGRAFLWIQAYLITALACNALLDENYGYLCRKPLNPSLLDHLGDWPWYLLSLEALALVFFLILHLPFVIGRQLRSPH